MLRLKSLVLCGAFACWVASSILSAELDSTSPPAQDAYQLASRALQAEAEGDFILRQRLLQEATSIDPDCELAKSLKNEIQINGEWLSIDDSVEQFKSASSLVNYERVRGSKALDVEEHYVLGQWCLSQQLKPQAYGHFNRVIQLDSNYLQARIALGYRWIGNEWISPAQAAAVKTRAEQAKLSIAEFGPKLQEIHKLLSCMRPAQRVIATQQLMAITDPNAVMAVEAKLCGPSTEISSVVIKWLATVDSVESSQLLTRYALMHPEDKICRQAAEALRTRPIFDFVPQLIAMTVSPVATTLVPAFNPDGSLAGFRNAFSQESSNQRKLLVLGSAFSQNALTANSEGNAYISQLMPRNDRVVRIANRQVEQLVNPVTTSDITTHQAYMQRDNEVIATRNCKIAAFLSFVTEQEIPRNSEGIWRWWDKYNESESQLNKSTSVEQASFGRETSDFQVYTSVRGNKFAPPPLPSPAQIAEQQAARQLFLSRGMRSECFVAGTPVMTQKGFVAIEKIRTGDMVLSRDIGSGSLQWQPVIEGTQRPAEATKEIRTSGNAFRCTGGHLFWISGKGWAKASELKVGDILHCAGEPTVVEEVKAMPDAPTFNLQVAENSNYFVGRELVLTHDVTERQPTRLRVPGLNELVVGR